MARLPRLCIPGIPHHVIQRGNNRQACFASDDDFIAYAHWLLEYTEKYRVAVHAWAFMTNHIHLLVTPETEDGISNVMQSLGRQYVRYFNYTYKRTGTLWEGRYKSCVVDAESYLLTCQRYIELNPVRAGMVEAPEEYKWSSYQANGLGIKARLCTPHELYIRLGKTENERLAVYRDLFNTHIDIDKIRNTTNKGMALGNDIFIQQVEKLSGRRVTPIKPGPKPKSTSENSEFLL